MIETFKTVSTLYAHKLGNNVSGQLGNPMVPTNEAETSVNYKFKAPRFEGGLFKNLGFRASKLIFR